MAMVDLAQQMKDQSKPLAIKLSSISGRQDIPIHYLEQLFLKLRRAGLVSSIRGSNGGYRLICSEYKIRIYDIIMAVENPLKITRCNIRSLKRNCYRKSGNHCPTYNLWNELSNIIHFFLKKITLADVLENKLDINYLLQ